MLPGGLADLSSLADALISLVTWTDPRWPDPNHDGLRVLGWLAGEFTDPPGGLGAIAMVAASPATQIAHRLVLVDVLRVLTRAPGGLAKPVAARRSSAGWSCSPCRRVSG